MRQPRHGQVYRCGACGLEVTTVRDTDGAFAPMCCGLEMQPLEICAVSYVCDVCYSQVTVLRGDPTTLQLSCCGTDMRLCITNDDRNGSEHPGGN